MVKLYMLLIVLFIFVEEILIYEAIYIKFRNYSAINVKNHMDLQFMNFVSK